MWTFRQAKGRAFHGAESEKSSNIYLVHSLLNFREKFSFENTFSDSIMKIVRAIMKRYCSNRNLSQIAKITKYLNIWPLNCYGSQNCAKCLYTPHVLANQCQKRQNTQLYIHKTLPTYEKLFFDSLNITNRKFDKKLQEKFGCSSLKVKSFWVLWLPRDYRLLIYG